MKITEISFALLVFGFFVLGCMSSAPSNGTDSGTNPSATVLPPAVRTLESNENFSAVLSYDPATRTATIEATQKFDAQKIGQLPFACAIRSTFLIRINDSSLYGESAKVNGTYQVRIPQEKYDQYVKASGLSGDAFQAMEVTTAVLRFQNRETGERLGECVHTKGKEITLDGTVLDSVRISESGQSGIRTR